MAMTVTYTTVNGQIVSENRSGAQSFYVADGLGSTVALMSSTGSLTDTFTYWPFGEVASHAGSSVTPFTFVGTLGYYLQVFNNFTYVRARYLRQALCRWQTAEPQWPEQPVYAYALSNPTGNVDPSGMVGLNALCYLVRYTQCIRFVNSWADKEGSICGSKYEIAVAKCRRQWKHIESLEEQCEDEAGIELARCHDRIDHTVGQLYELCQSNPDKVFNMGNQKPTHRRINHRQKGLPDG